MTYSILRIFSRFNDDASLLQSTRKGVSWTLGYHGDPAGSITGDERESGQAPNRGYERPIMVWRINA